MPNDDPPVPSDRMSAKPPPDRLKSDKVALARLGAAVHKRLAADPAAHRIPIDRADIFTVGAFLSARECAHLRAMIDEVAEPSSTYDPQNSVKYRTSYSGNVDPHDNFVRMIERRICDLLGIEGSWGETVQGQRYQPGQEFHAHFDWFDTNGSYWPDEIRRGGQRSWTAMAYLNTMPEGGATVFTEVGLSVQPQAGALLIWNNMRPDGTPNPDVRHAALPVVNGIKYVITKWFRTRPWG
jgi:prolyl 4-hydroxylase